MYAGYLEGGVFLGAGHGCFSYKWESAMSGYRGEQRLPSDALRMLLIVDGLCKAPAYVFTERFRTRAESWMGQ